jgi:hypothetical protein
MLKIKEKEEMCKAGEILMENRMYGTAMRHFALAFSDDHNYARAALGIAEISLKKLENTVSSFKVIDDVAGKNPFMKKLIESDREFFTKNGEKESETAMKHFGIVKELVEKKRDTSDLLGHRPNVLNECSKAIERVSELNNLFL